MITHTITFRLKHPAGSAEEIDFLEAALKLRSIDGVQNLRCLRQVSGKNAFSFGLTMEFDDQAAYDTYSSHPDHTRFVEERWIPEVDEFLELDYVPWQE